MPVVIIAVFVVAVVFSCDYIRGYVRPSVGTSVCRSIGPPVRNAFWRAETQTANDLCRGYGLVVVVVVAVANIVERNFLVILSWETGLL